MDKKDFITDYFLGTREYTKFLLSIVFGETISYNLEEKYIKYAKLGIMTYILTNLKEISIEKKEDKTNISNLVDGKLVKNVKKIAEYKNGKYKIGDKEFLRAEDVVITIRNKIAHGNYILEDKFIILNIENKEVKIEFQKLFEYICLSIQNAIKYCSPHERKRQFALYIDYLRKFDLTKKIKEQNLDTILEDIYYNEIKMKPLTKENLTEKTIEDLEKTIKEYKKTCNDELIKKFGIKRNGVIDFEFKKTKLTKEEKEKLKSYAKNSLVLDNLDLHSVVGLLDNELCNIKNEDEYAKNWFFYFFINDCFILDGIEKSKSTCFNDILAYSGILDECKIDYVNVLAGELAMFTALFSYGLDDVFAAKEDKIYKDDYFDFSKLDLTGIEILENNKENSKIKGLEDKLKKQIKDKQDLNHILKNDKKNLINVFKKHNNKALKNILKKIKKELQELDKNEENIEILKKEIEDIKNKFPKKYNNNYFIIESIRNSIIHGNYKLELADNISKINIVFYDVYEGKLTFKCKVNIICFFNILEKNFSNVIGYLNKDNVKVKKLGNN